MVKFRFFEARGWINPHPLIQIGLLPALITPVSNCAEYKKVSIGNIRQKISYKEINATRKNNADLGPAL